MRTVATSSDLMRFETKEMKETDTASASGVRRICEEQTSNFYRV